MQVIITDAWIAKRRPLHLNGFQLGLALSGLVLLLIMAIAGIYHLLVVTGAREGWPVVGSVMRMVVREELSDRDRYVRENLDAMAIKLGEMQAKMMQLDALGERVGGMAGISPAELKAQTTSQGKGGILVEGRPLNAKDIDGMLTALSSAAQQKIDLFSVMESRLFDQKMKNFMLPTQHPVVGVDVGSSFGYRIDPFTGLNAMHTGQDYAANIGTPIVAAAGGIVSSVETHPQYGRMLVVQHGEGISTLYGHTSRVLVKSGDLVRRGQRIAEVGSTGRSTGPHLHFEVLMNGTAQNPTKFLEARKSGNQVAKK